MAEDNLTNQTSQTTPVESKASGNQTLVNQKPPHKFPIMKFGLVLILIAVSLTLLGGGYYFGKQSALRQLNPGQPKPIPSRDPDIYKGSPTPTLMSGEISDWKTFNDTINKISFKYPSTWTAKKDSNWTFTVFLDDHPFETCDACEFMTPIQFGFNEFKNTETNQRSYFEKTLAEGEKRILELLDTKTTTVKKMSVDGKEAVQITGIGGPGPLEGTEFKYTLIQMDNKLLIADVSKKEFYDEYDQIIESLKFN